MKTTQKLLTITILTFSGLSMTACTINTADKKYASTAPHTIAPAAGAETKTLPLTTDEARNASY